MRSKLPIIVERLLTFFVQSDRLEDLLGDMEEYQNDLEEYPKWKRSFVFWYQVFNCIRPSLMKSIVSGSLSNQSGVIHLGFRSALRGMVKNKLVTNISIASLVIGAVGFNLIYSWIHNELETDKFHSNLDNIYVGTFQSDPATNPNAMILSEFFDIDFAQYPAIKKSLAIHFYRSDEIKVITETTELPGYGYVADSTFLDFFDFPLIYGNRNTILNDPANIVLTESYSKTLFGEKDPIGQVIGVKCDNQGVYKVAGILADLPSNSSLTFDFVVPKHSQRFWRRLPSELILVNKGYDIEDFNEQIKHNARSQERFLESTLAYYPFKKIYFERPFNFILFGKYGSQEMINTLLFISIMLVLIAFFIFISLQSTHQISSSKKLGIKKLIGATGLSLFTELVISRLLYLLISVFLAYGLYQLIFPYFLNALQIEIDSKPWFDLMVMIAIISAMILCSLIAGMIQLIRIQTVEALVGKRILFKIPKIQRYLGVLQYAITILLIVCTGVVYFQYQYMKNKKTGFEAENILRVDFFDIINGGRNQELREATLKSHRYVTNQLNNHPDIINVSQGNMPIDEAGDLISWKISGSNDEHSSIDKLSVDPDYLDLLGLELLQGRFFAEDIDTLMTRKVVINEAAMNFWGLKDITGVKLANSMWGGETTPFEIIGVVKDYHYEHLSKEIEPLVLMYRTYEDYAFLIKYQEGKQNEVISFIETLFEEINPKGIFQYEFLEDRVAAQYEKEKQMGSIYFSFTILALVLSAIGLFVFALHETRRRTKEIGIRKINGAKLENIYQLLSFSFLKTIAFAFLIATPIGWYLMNEWLQDFAHRINLSWWIFGLSGIIAIVVAILATSWQTLKIAHKNPVESLRYE